MQVQKIQQSVVYYITEYRIVSNFPTFFGYNKFQIFVIVFIYTFFLIVYHCSITIYCCIIFLIFLWLVIMHGKYECVRLYIFWWYILPFTNSCYYYHFRQLSYFGFWEFYKTEILQNDSTKWSSYRKSLFKNKIMELFKLKLKQVYCTISTWYFLKKLIWET
jgi:hypothetical protein